MAIRLGLKIRALRIEKGLSIEKLAEMTDASRSCIWKLENRIPCNPKADKLSKISMALGVTMDYLANDAIDIFDKHLR